MTVKNWHYKGIKLRFPHPLYAPVEQSPIWDTLLEWFYVASFGALLGYFLSWSLLILPIQAQWQADIDTGTHANEVLWGAVVQQACRREFFWAAANAWYPGPHVQGYKGMPEEDWLVLSKDLRAKCRTGWVPKLSEVEQPWEGD